LTVKKEGIPIINHRSHGKEAFYPYCGGETLESGRTKGVLSEKGGRFKKEERKKTNHTSAGEKGGSVARLQIV